MVNGARYAGVNFVCSFTTLLFKLRVCKRMSASVRDGFVGLLTSGAAAAGGSNSERGQQYVWRGGGNGRSVTGSIALVSDQWLPYLQVLYVRKGARRADRSRKLHYARAARRKLSTQGCQETVGI